MVKSKESMTRSSVESHKRAQFDVIQASNPAYDDVHTWVRSVGDILTFGEAIRSDPDFVGEDWTPDYTWDDTMDAVSSGEITVYSSNRIRNGTWVTPSKMEAQSYAGGSQVYSMKVKLEDIAWVDGMQGMYAKVR